MNYQKKINKKIYERIVRELKETLLDNQDSVCETRFVKYDELDDGRIVEVGLIVQYPPQDPFDISAREDSPRKSSTKD